MLNYYNICKSAMYLLSSLTIEPNNAIIFDIDDTLIDKYGQCIIPVIQLYNYAKTLGLIPIIITARLDEVNNINYTLYQLHTCNITDYHEIFFRPENMLNLYEYKNSRRKHIYDSGFKVLMSVGDMPWDIGQYGGIGIYLK